MIRIEVNLAELLAYYGVASASAIDATVLYSCMRFNQLWKADDPEESLSGTFRGILAGAFPFCAQYIADETQSPTECYWGQFKKSAANGDMDFDHESLSGADFSLVLKDARGEYLVSLFQAKKAEGRSMNLYRREPKPEKGKWRKSQFLTLVKYAQHLNQVATGTRGTIRRLHWVHYLGYAQRKTACLPLSTLSAEHEIERRADKEQAVAKNKVLLSDPRFVDLFAVLLSGVRAAVLNRRAWGWLRVSSVGLGSLLPELMRLTDVYVVDEERAGVNAILSTEYGRSPEVESVRARPRPAPAVTPTATQTRRPKSRL